MAGNISNSNIWKEDDKKAQKEVESMFSEMIGWAVDEGADMLIGETFYYAGEAFKALEVMKKANLPTVLTISPMGENKMRDGMSVVDTCKELGAKRGRCSGLKLF
jgi:betaine-homocysteine S-methyltransferase